MFVPSLVRLFLKRLRERSLVKKDVHIMQALLFMFLLA